MSDPYIGEIAIFAGNFAPEGWAFCDGQLLPIAQHTALFSLYGTIYGGDGETTFALPDLQGRGPMHFGHGPGLTSRAIGEGGGVDAITLSAAQLPKHTHPWRVGSDPADQQARAPDRAMTRSSVDAYRSSPVPGELAALYDGLPEVGGGQPHDNWQPYLALNYIVALVGTYPSE